MLDGPFSPWPSFTQEEAQAVQDILLSNKVNYWTGTECIEFEKEFARFAETEYAIAVANGTNALDLALKGLGIGEKGNEEVIVTSRTYVASASCIANAGAVPFLLTSIVILKTSLPPQLLKKSPPVLALSSLCI